jgi:uncharacterized membrane protein
MRCASVYGAVLGVHSGTVSGKVCYVGLADSFICSSLYLLILD